MKKITLFFVFVLSITCAMSQNICLKLDSVKFTYIPFRIKTVYSVEKNEILQGRTLNNYRKMKLITDSQELSALSSIVLNGSNDRFTKVNEDEIDFRGVLIYYLEGGLTDTLALDKLRGYTKNRNYYKQNYKLMLWINEYAYYSIDRIYTKQGSTVLKQKYNFLIETLEKEKSSTLPQK